MVFAILPMVLIAFGAAGLLGMCSFNPGGPATEDAQVPTVDPAAELQRASGQVDFPVLHPQPPADWRANSANVAGADPERIVRVGWLTPDGDYLRLAQSAAAEQDLVSAETRRPPQAQGTVRAADRDWVVYDSVRSEQAWVTERDGVRLLITGSGDEAEFRALAEAAAQAEPVR
ncbi:DUF4245 domain-containing protein [Saccharopolyspora sp. HNM0983]|uniref:DUF4245 domain-containing protein n=2 Tax=Saccharopolyspora montiporae TaxID=2781240 RepID=A0A929G0H8_9PSEU|nr:DUF4245 domain-containing protein [Saccharopolyspora sp. HNM0983]MBE9375635.1 DUF4245 domain-containing protein [Saccharopolyspora sp. HNM0983]